LVAVVLSTAAAAQPTKTSLVNAVATASARRAELEQYVKALKAALRPPDPAYAESQRRYVSAFTVYNALVADIAVGGKKSATFLASKVELVDRQTADFTEYASEALFGKRRNIPGLAHSTGTLMAVVNDQQSVLHINRHTAAVFLTALQWRSWTDIQ
jgi:hypothetical protein